MQKTCHRETEKHATIEKIHAVAVQNRVVSKVYQSNRNEQTILVFVNFFNIS